MDFLKKLLEARKAKLQTLEQRNATCENIEELRAIQAEAAEIRQEIADLEMNIALEEEGSQQRGIDPTLIGGGTDLESRAAEEAFMEYACRGAVVDGLEMRANEVGGITEQSAVIPTTILKEIIKELDSHGEVYRSVRHLNIKGGVSIPVLSLKPTATWVGEGASETQKVSAKDKITFTYYGVECKIAQTILANIVTLEEFKALFVPLAAEAIVAAVEVSIFNGDGENKPLGITKDTRIPSKNVITINGDDWKSWAKMKKKIFAKMKKAYRKGNFYMAQGTFDGYVDGMEDSVGQPIARVNYGIAGAETYRWGGKNVVTVDDDCLPAWEDAAEGDVVMVFMVPTNYVINTNGQMTSVKWVDHDTNEVKTKVSMIVDGKLADANGVLIIKKGADATAASNEEQTA